MKYAGGVVAAAVVAGVGYGLYEATQGAPPTPSQTTQTTQATSSPSSQVTLRGVYIDEIRERKEYEIIKEFEDANPGVKCVWEFYNFQDLYTKALSILSTGNTDYDIVQFHHPDLKLFAPWCTDLTEWVQRDAKDPDFMLDDIHPLLHTTHMQYGGSYYGVPSHVNPVNFAYRTDIFDQLGLKVPETWDDFVAAEKLITEKMGPTTYGAALGLKRDIMIPSTFLPMMAGYNTKICSVSTLMSGKQYFSPTMNTPDVIAALKTLLEMKKYATPGSTTYGFDETMMSFAKGKGAMTVMWSSIVSYWNDPKTSDIVGKYALAPMPGNKQPDGTVPHGTLLGGWTITIPKVAPHKEEAWKLLKWIVSPKVETELVDYYESCRLSVLEASSATHPNNAAFLDYMNRASEGGIIDFPGVDPGIKILPDYDVVDVMQSDISEMLTGATTPEQCAAKLQKDYEAIFRKNDMLPPTYGT